MLQPLQVTTAMMTSSQLEHLILNPLAHSQKWFSKEVYEIRSSHLIVFGHLKVIF